MKNKLFIFSAILLVAVTTITIVSCKKDNEKSNKTENLVNSHELSDMDKEMIAFGEKLKTASDERSGETMPLDEALTTLSNYQNFKLCDASHYSTEVLTDTLYVSLNVTNGEVLLSELNRIYELTKPEILSKFNSLSGSQKAIYYIRSIVDESMRGDRDNFTGTLDVKVISHMVDDPIMPDPMSFNSTDYWYDFEYLGKCDIYEGQCVGRDCVTELNAKLHNRRGELQCLEGYRVYLTNIEQSEEEAIHYPDSNSPNGHYAWPWRSGLELPQCVSPSEMTYYLHAIEEAMGDIEDYYYRTIVDFQFGEVNKLPWKEPNYIWEAKLYFTVGEVNCTFVGWDY